MEKKITVGKVIIGIVAFLSLAILMLIITSKILVDKESINKYKEFYEEEENFDVLFFGSSRMLEAVYPVALWDEYGITSYNMAQHAEGLKTTYWQVKNALAYTTPQVIVIDISLFWAGEITDSDVTEKSYLHKSLDHFPNTSIKRQALEDLLDDDVGKMEYYFPIILYHNRWSQLEKRDIFPVEEVGKGADFEPFVMEQEYIPWNEAVCTDTLDPIGINLEAILNLCEENNIAVIFTYMPCAEPDPDYEQMARINEIERWLQNRDYTVLNFSKMEEIVNYQTDFFDQGHLNPSGARKITKYLGEYLVANYALPIEKSTETINAWEIESKDYKTMKLEALQEQKANPAHLLMLLNDTDYSIVISINPKGWQLENVAIIAMLEEYGAKKISQTDGYYVFIKEGNSEKVQEYVENKDINTRIDLGSIAFDFTEDGKVGATILGVQYETLIEEVYMYITVFDSQTGAFIEQIVY